MVSYISKTETVASPIIWQHESPLSEVFVLEKYICIIIVLLELYALPSDSWLLQGKYRKGFLGYYTALSNLLMLVYFAALLIFRGELAVWLRKDVVILSIMLCINVTFLIYHFIISGDVVRKYRNGEAHTPFNLTNLSLHYIVPMLVIFYWTVYGSKSQLTYADAFRWLIVPFVYVCYVFVRKALGIRVEEYRHGYYPYKFMDIEQYGIKRVAINAVMLFGGYALLGLVFVFLARHI